MITVAYNNNENTLIYLLLHIRFPRTCRFHPVRSNVPDGRLHCLKRPFPLSREKTQRGGVLLSKNSTPEMKIRSTQSGRKGPIEWPISFALK